MDTLVDSAFMHSLRYLCNGFSTQPVVRVPGVCEFHLKACFDCRLIKELKIDLLVHALGAKLILSVDPENFREATYQRGLCWVYEKRGRLCVLVLI